MGDEELVDAVEQRLSPALQETRELGEAERGADAVLVAHQRAHGVAERLLVAEHEGLTLALRPPGRPSRST